MRLRARLIGVSPSPGDARPAFCLCSSSSCCGPLLLLLLLLASDATVISDGRTDRSTVFCYRLMRTHARTPGG